MARINLRDYYPSLYITDQFIEVSEEVAEALAEAKRENHAYYERRRYHRAFYSLNAGDGIEREALYHAPSPEEIIMKKLTLKQLNAALTALPELQHRRVKAHYIDGISKYEIARAGGVDESTVRESTRRGLRNMKKYLNNFF